jgi:hypothetical protein
VEDYCEHGNEPSQNELCSMEIINIITTNRPKIGPQQTKPYKIFGVFYSSKIVYTLKMGAAGVSEKEVTTYKNIRHHSPEEHTLNSKLLLLLLLLLLYSPLLGLGRFFTFLILYTVGRTP